MLSRSQSLSPASPHSLTLTNIFQDRFFWWGAVWLLDGLAWLVGSGGLGVWPSSLPYSSRSAFRTPWLLSIPHHTTLQQKYE